MAQHRATDRTGAGTDCRTIVFAILRATRQQRRTQHNGQVSCFHILVPFVIDIAPANYEPDVAVSFIRRNELQFYTENIRLLPSIETSAVAIISLRELRSD
jgi:hypothetical protein